MTETEKRNLDRVKLWEKTWNEDVMRMVDELYAEDCEVRNMITGFVVHGRENFREVERAIEKHINALFHKLGLSEETDVHRRVMAVLAFLKDAP